MDGSSSLKYITFIVLIPVVGAVAYLSWEYVSLVGPQSSSEVSLASTTPIATTTLTTSTSTASSFLPFPVASTTATTTVPVAAKPVAQTTVKPVTKKSVAAPAKVRGIGPLSYLVGLKQPLSCTVQTMSGIKRSGTLYVASGKVRINFTDSGMIADGTSLYAWISGATQGVKLPSNSSVSGSVIATNGGIDPAIDISYACNPWVENTSYFIPPTSISFSSSLYH